MIKNPTSVLLVVGMTLMVSKFAPSQTIASVDAERARQISDKGLAEGESVLGQKIYTRLVRVES